VVVGVLSLPSSGLFYFRLRQEKAAAQKLTEVREKSEAVDDLLTQLLNLETGIRGYASTQDSRFLDPYWEGRRQVPIALERLDPSHQLSSLHNQANQALLLSDKLIRNPSPAGLEQGKETMDRLRVILSELKLDWESERDRLLNTRERRERRDLILVVLAVGALVLLLWLIYQSAGDMKVAFTKAEEALGLEEELREAQKLAANETERVLEKERELSEAKSLVIQTISHEYRTPLTAILTAAELLEIIDPLSDKRHRYIHQIKKGVKRLNQMTEDVLTMFHLDSASVLTEARVVYLLPWFQSLIESFQDSDRVILDIQVPEFSCDESLLYKVFSNLISNALKYSSESVLVAAIADEDSIRFSVKDSGIGIPPSMRIFAAFERGANVGMVPGTGLGLSIVKKAVELLGGSISVESQEGETEFIVALPLH
jgi:signal transduction histidine kinase